MAWPDPAISRSGRTGSPSRASTNRRRKSPGNIDPSGFNIACRDQPAHRTQQIDDQPSISPNYQQTQLLPTSRPRSDNNAVGRPDLSGIFPAQPLTGTDRGPARYFTLSRPKSTHRGPTQKETGIAPGVNIP